MFQKLMQFMFGRRGNDELNICLIVAALILGFVNIFFRVFGLYLVYRVVYLVQLILIVMFFARFLSKNIPARQKENDAFLRFTGKFKKSNNDDYNTVYSNDPVKKSKNYKYFKCPNCSAKLRVPKGKGKITITCPKCRTSFKGRS